MTTATAGRNTARNGAFTTLVSAWTSVPPASRWRRAGLGFLVGLGLVVALTRSFIYQSTPPIPAWYVPDARLPFLFLTGLGISAFAAWGGAARRVQLLLFVSAASVLAHVEVSTIHWFTDAPGSLTGARLDPVGFAGSLAALFGVVLLHVEVEAWRYANDLKARGAEPERCGLAARHLSRGGFQRVGLAAAAVLGLALVVAVGERVIGEASLGAPVLALVAGGLLLAVALFYTVQALKK